MTHRAGRAAVDVAGGASLPVATDVHVALVVPSQRRVYGPFSPPRQIHLGLAYLAAAIEDLCTVTVIDLDAERLDVAGFATRVRSGRFDIVGFTVATPAYTGALELAATVRKELPEAWTVFGGYHPTLMPQEVLSQECVDFAVVGEGEEALRDLVKARRGGREARGIAGIGYRDSGGRTVIPSCPEEPQGDLDKLRFPARRYFSPVYTYPDALHRRVAPVLTSRGCPGDCSFCNAPNMYRRRSRFRSAVNVADEIEALVRHQGFREIHIWDDNFTTRRQRVFELRDELKRRRLRVPIALPGGIRADSVSPEIMDALRDMGVYSLALGVESGVQEILDAAGKGVALDQIRQAVAWARQRRIETWAFFLIGLPGETPESLRQTIAFALELDPDIAKFHIAKPFPGTRLRRIVEEQGWLLSPDYADLGIHLPPVHRLPALSPEEMVEWQARAYREFYFGSPQRIWRQVRRIRSWRRLLVNLRGGIGLIRLLGPESSRCKRGGDANAE